MRDDKGRFAEGNEGRPKGIPNKTTTEIRETFQLLLENNIEKIQEDLNELDPKDRIKLLLDLSSFIIPKMKSVDLKADKKETILIDFSEDISFEEN